MLNTLYILAGVLFLYIGGEALVRGAYRGALRVGVTPLVAGLVVVSCSTSMPEAVSSIVAQLRGNLGSVALGNIIGSNIANVGLILGLTALVQPVRVAPVMAKREMPLMLLSLIILGLFLLIHFLGRLAGIILLALLVLYIILQVILGRKEHQKPLTLHTNHWGWARDLFLIVGGAIGLVVGGYSLIEGALGVARALQLSERIIGLTIVAIGSSLPELATTLVAALRRQSDIALGNVIGSNVFNALLITGVVCLIHPLTYAPRLLLIDTPVMIGLSLLLWALTARPTISRPAGALLLVLYAAYLTVLLTTHF